MCFEYVFLFISSVLTLNGCYLAVRESYWLADTVSTLPTSPGPQTEFCFLVWVKVTDMAPPTVFPALEAA